jgi:hypothetical protein
MYASIEGKLVRNYNISPKAYLYYAYQGLFSKHLEFTHFYSSIVYGNYAVNMEK